MYNRNHVQIKDNHRAQINKNNKKTTTTIIMKLIRTNYLKNKNLSNQVVWLKILTKK